MKRLFKLNIYALEQRVDRLEKLVLSHDNVMMNLIDCVEKLNEGINAIRAYFEEEARRRGEIE